MNPILRTIPKTRPTLPISPRQAQVLARLGELSRMPVVDGIKSQIEAGTYETEPRLDPAIDALINSGDLDD
jgi:hypothetical protein